MVGAVIDCPIECPSTPLASSCFSYCLVTLSPDPGPLIMSQPFQNTPSPSSFPNTSQSLQQGNAPLYNIPVSNYPPFDQGPNDFPEHQFSEADLSLEDPEWENFSSLFYSGEDWSLPLESSQTSRTDPSQEACPQIANSIQSQDVPVDPLLGSDAFHAPTNQASAESVNDLGFQTQTKPRQQVSEGSIP
jgi:hypothetical protein